MREIILDTETTGLDPAAGHRVVEIGCVESLNHIPTDESFHRYVNPERDMPEEAYRVHGLSTEFLSDKPLFADVVDDFLAFIGDSRLVIHNASFDMKFLNAELALLGRPPLDALCRRFEIDLSVREKHGALLDAELLAEVYLELRGGRQPDLALVGTPGRQAGAAAPIARPVRPPRPHMPSEEEQAAHAAMVAALKDPVWTR